MGTSLLKCPANMVRRNSTVNDLNSGLNWDWIKADHIHKFRVIS